MASNSFKVKNSINLEPKTSPTLDAAGDVGYNSTAGEFEIRDASATRSLVTDDGSQVLTNKTISGSSNTLSNIASTSTTLATETSVSVATSNTASTINIGNGTDTNTINIGGANTTVNITGTVNNQNVTNLNVTDKLITINDGGGAGSGSVAGIEIEENAVTTGYIVTSADRNSWEIKAPNTAGVTTLTPGTGADTIALLAASQTFTNKTHTAPIIDIAVLDGQGSTPSNPSSGFYKMYVKDSTSELVLLDSAGTETSIGSGSGSGSKNYFSAAQSSGLSVTGFNAYADAAGTLPVDMTGGSPSGNLTIAVSASSPLTGLNSITLAKTAANLQGEGKSIDFTLDTSDKGKVLAFSMDYAVSSGTYADDDALVYFYDATNSVLLQPTPYKLKNHSLGSDKFFAEIQVPYNCTTLRMGFHVSSTSASAYTLKFDNLLFGPQAKLYGSVTTDWISYTPTFTGFGTVTGIEAYWRKSGTDMEVRVKSVAGTTTAVEGRVSIPATSADTTIIPSIQNCGKVARNATAAEDLQVTCEPSVSYVTFTSTSASTSGLTKRNGNDLIATGNTWSFTAKIPILGWSSSQLLSQDADTRVVAASYSTASSQSITTDTIIDFDTIISDTHGSVTTGASWKFTAKKSGRYKINSGVHLTGTNPIYLTIFKNGSSFKRIAQAASNLANGSAEIDLISGDYIDIRGSTTGTVALIGSASLVYIDISKIQGPTQIAASEVVSFSANTSTTVASTSQPIIYTNVLDNSHGSYNVSTGRFTAQTSGFYFFEATGYFGVTVAFLSIYKNGSQFKQGTATIASTEAAVVMGGFPLVTGDIVDIRPSTSATASGGAVFNFFSGFKVT